MTTLPKLECRRCGHRWVARVADPKTCASKKCKSPYWNKPRGHASRPTRRAR